MGSPCAQSAREHCCKAEESFAVLTTAPREMTESWYCPRDRRFAAFRLPTVGVRACLACGRAAVKAEAVERAWYWCDVEGLWSQEPCPLNVVKKCCGKVEGKLPAAPDSGPIATLGGKGRQPGEPRLVRADCGVNVQRWCGCCRR